MHRTMMLAASFASSLTAFGQESSIATFHPPVRLEAAGEPIDIGLLSDYAHAGPELADLDGDGDRDLLVGDFPGYFWFFENTGDDQEPRYQKGVKWQAGGKDAKTPVY